MGRERVLVSYVMSGVLAVVLLVGDIVMPRGVTAAIGYCIVPVLLAANGRRTPLFVMTGICTVFTWVGYWTEQVGIAPWMSVFDRLMVCGVLWLTVLLVWRRSLLIETLVQQTQALRRAKLELEQTNADLDAFASAVAHDVRGPLNTIGLFAQLLGGEATLRSDDKSRAWAASINGEVMRLNRLIENLLRYGRCGEVVVEQCDCEGVLAEVRRSLRAQIESARAQVTNDPLPLVHADRALLADVLQNLVENSIKYRGEGEPRIHVSAQRGDDEWIFAVRDNGIGVGAEHVEQIFKPFRQVNGLNVGGVGLGLATCKRIIERHGGRIEVHSTGGAGATFRFTIPDPPTATELSSPQRQFTSSNEDPCRAEEHAGLRA